MDLESRALERGTTYRFQLRLDLGTVTPAVTPSRMGDLAAGVRRAADLLARRAEAVAGLIDRLAALGWRPLDAAPIGRETLAPHAFAGPQGSALPESVAVVREATPEELARDLADAGGDLTDELTETLTARVEGLDIPTRLDAAGAAELRYSPREFLETFSIWC